MIFFEYVLCCMITVTMTMASEESNDESESFQERKLKPVYELGNQKLSQDIGLLFFESILHIAATTQNTLPS